MSGTELIRGLRDLVDSRTTGKPLTMADRVRFDILGVGLGQALSTIYGGGMTYEAFERWVVEIAGRPDPIAVERFHAWLDGAPMPEAAQQRLAEIDAAEPALDADELAHWDREGYVILRSAVTRDEAAAAAALLWEVIGADPADPASWYPGDRGTIMVEQFQSPAQTALRASKRLHKAFAQLWGTTDLWVRTDRTSFNPPHREHSPNVGPRLHWDTSLAPPIAFETHGILYLTDTSADQGALEVVPGFHRRIESWLETLGDTDPRSVDLSAEAVPIAANAGDLVIWRQELPHGATPNLSSRPRLAQYLYCYSADTVVNPVWR